MNELRAVWNSPVVGAYLLWRFVLGYHQESGVYPNMALAFPAVTILMQPQFTDELSPRIRSLEGYVKKLVEKSKRGYLNDLGNDIREHKDSILAVIETAVVLEMVSVNYENGTLETSRKETKELAKFAADFRKEMGGKAETLGKRFGAVSAETVCNLLGVYFS